MFIYVNADVIRIKSTTDWEEITSYPLNITAVVYYTEKELVQVNQTTKSVDCELSLVLAMAIVGQAK